VTLGFGGAEVGAALVAAADVVVGAGAGAVATAGVALVVSGGRTVGFELFPLHPASRTALTRPTDTTWRSRAAIRMGGILNDTQRDVCTLSTGFTRSALPDRDRFGGLCRNIADLRSQAGVSAPTSLLCSAEVAREPFSPVRRGSAARFRPG
jgi:hypothetical protein